MNNILLFINVFFGLWGNLSYADAQNSKSFALKPTETHAITDFIPKGYVITDKISGDLNKDHLEDYVIIIKGTDKKKFVRDKYTGALTDRNRRGIIVLLKEKNGYQLAVKNYDCFSSENEDGGNYIPPELDLSIKKGNLYIHYGHGRYGWWEYTFRFNYQDFELIGFDESDNRGPVVNTETSINYLTHKKIVKENTNTNAETDGEEVFKTTATKISVVKLSKLSQIKDFDELDMLNTH